MGIPSVLTFIKSVCRSFLLEIPPARLWYAISVLHRIVKERV